MKQGIVKPDSKVYVAIEGNRELHLKIDGVEFKAHLEHCGDGDRLRSLIQDDFFDDGGDE